MFTFLFGSFWPAVVILPILSLYYYWLGSQLPVNERLMASSHGVLLLLSVAYTIAISGRDGLNDIARTGFAAIVLLAIGSTIYSCWVLRVRWYFHLAHIITIWYVLVVLFFEGMTRDSF